MKKLELDPETRERILLGHDGGVTGPTRSRFAGRRAAGQQRIGDEPYYADRAGRLLSVHQQHQSRQNRGLADESDAGSGSPLKNMFGILSGKLKSVMKSLFPIKLFPDQPEEDMAEQKETEKEGRYI